MTAQRSQQRPMDQLPPVQRRKAQRPLAQRLAGWSFVAPALAVIGLFFVLPVAIGLGLSFTDFDLYALADWRNLRFAGLDNYVHVLSLPLFWLALKNTLVFVVLGVPLSIALSLGCAVLLQSPLARFKPFFRTALFAPVVTTLVAVALIWRYLFHVRYGLITNGRQIRLLRDSSRLIKLSFLDFDRHRPVPIRFLALLWSDAVPCDVRQVRRIPIEIHSRLQCTYTPAWGANARRAASSSWPPQTELHLTVAGPPAGIGDLIHATTTFSRNPIGRRTSRPTEFSIAQA